MRNKDAFLVAEFHDAFNGHDVHRNYDGSDALEANINIPTFKRSHKRIFIECEAYKVVRCDFFLLFLLICSKKHIFYA